ncbi:tagaturonate reductase [Algoriphagus halophytocola]|uniref:Tagaturonate reductase n=1 Tax=Algoriphagus halophytocola TaxID=2991499 RepID=A0ABY6ML86_9BACT|nr:MULTISPECIES: tagaturonate reductase [unclassified Algoriphagus]UZD24533.1 tagaturonate reductase [Algoriphagus sp. TR-M5]WBL41897.1 tagaturonate reductase [Algoriphagus sp. TR-M9]
MKSLTKDSLNLKSRPTKVLQFGEGNFLRGFVDWMIDLANEKGVFDGNVQMVQPLGNGLIDLIKKQDSLYHVLLQGLQEGKQVEESRLITCIEDILNPADSYEEYLRLGENPDMRFVISNTTEAGIQFDANDTGYSNLPLTFPGKLCALLYRRFQFFEGAADKGLIFIPCELIDKNGENLKDCIDKYATLWKLPMAFSDWLESHSIFCNTLVDRIVPGFPKDKINEIQKELDYEDNLVVMAEPFHLWVIEAPDEVQQEFPLDQIGLEVKFVKDQTPFRTRKVRILNGGHTSMVPFAYLKGLRTVRESVEDPLVGTFLREAIFDEIIPTLDMPKEELEKFANDVLERFANPFIVHELKSIALNSISKFKVRVLPSLLGYYDVNQVWPERLTTSLAALLVFYRGEYKGETLPLNDSAEVLQACKKAWEEPNPEKTVQQLLSNKEFWGQDLSVLPGLTEKVTQEVNALLT